VLSLEAAVDCQPHAKQSDVETGESGGEKAPVPPPDDWRPKQSVRPVRCRGCRTLCSSYRNFLRSKPLLASCITAVVIMCMGDAGAQFIEWQFRNERMVALRRERVDANGFAGRMAQGSVALAVTDVRRTALMAGYSATVFTPIYFGLYTLMERLCASDRSTLSVARHSIFVLAAGAPGDALLLVVVPYLEQLLLGQPQTFAEAESLAGHKLREDVPRLLRATFCFWGSFNVLNFWLMPPHLHLLFSSAASVCWNMYLSYIAHEHLMPAGLLNAASAESLRPRWAPGRAHDLWHETSRQGTSRVADGEETAHGADARAKAASASAGLDEGVRWPRQNGAWQHRLRGRPVGMAAGADARDDGGASTADARAQTEESTDTVSEAVKAAASD